jgi:hypothetical protein
MVEDGLESSISSTNLGDKAVLGWTGEQQQHKSWRRSWAGLEQQQ